MNKNITLISHIYNEEYLLPFWLEYHKNIFSHGIIIDYYSTDNTVDIIKKICPEWTIVKTVNVNADGSLNFDAALIDVEVKNLEKGISGFKIALNVTEFILYNMNTLDFVNSFIENTCYHIKSYSVASTHVDYYPHNTTEFFKNIQFIGDTNRGYRYLHDQPFLDYCVGRHSYNNIDLFSQECNDIILIHVKYYPYNTHMDKRVLQIQNNIPQSNKNRGFGYHHIIDKNKLISERHTIKKSFGDINSDDNKLYKQMIDNAIIIVSKNNIEKFKNKYGNYNINIVIIVLIILIILLFLLIKFRIHYYII